MKNILYISLLFFSNLILTQDYHVAKNGDDYIPAKKYWDQQSSGKSIKIVSAYIKIGDKEYKVDLSDNLKTASVNIDISSGKTSLEPGFILDNGDTSIAFYTDIDFLF